MVIGYVRPVILMPVGLLAGLPAGQVESILLHELAHIRRHDYLVNLMQIVVEGLVFYHPAVWWISGVIRAERENCCDDLVVATQGDALAYAAALTALEQNRGAVREAVLAATGGSLVKRVRRLLVQPEGPRAALTPVFSAAILTISLAAAMAAWQSTPPPVRPPAPPVPLLAQVQQTPAPSGGHPYRQVAQPGRRLHHHRRRARRIQKPAIRSGTRALHRTVLAAPRSHSRHRGKRIQRGTLPAHRLRQRPLRSRHPRLEDRSRPDLHHLRSARREGDPSLRQRGETVSIRAVALSLHRRRGDQRRDRVHRSQQDGRIPHDYRPVGKDAVATNADTPKAGATVQPHDPRCGIDLRSAHRLWRP